MPSTKPTPTDPPQPPQPPEPVGPVGLSEATRLRLATGLRLTFDTVRGQHVLLGPESVLVLNPTGAAIVELCDGQRDIAAMITLLQARFAGVEPGHVRAFLNQLTAKRCVEVVHEPPDNPRQRDQP